MRQSIEYCILLQVGEQVPFDERVLAGVGQRVGQLQPQLQLWLLQDLPLRLGVRHRDGGKYININISGVAKILIIIVWTKSLNWYKCFIDLLEEKNVEEKYHF